MRKVEHLLRRARGVTETKKGCAEQVRAGEEPVWAKMGQDGPAEGRDRADPGYQRNRPEPGSGLRGRESGPP